MTRYYIMHGRSGEIRPVGVLGALWFFWIGPQRRTKIATRRLPK